MTLGNWIGMALGLLAANAVLALLDRIEAERSRRRYAAWLKSPEKAEIDAQFQAFVDLTGPAWKRKAPSPGWKMLVPVTSAGIRSGVNWMRE